MSIAKSYFIDFLSKIRLTETQEAECSTGHNTLRERLREFEGLKDVVIADFLQGSYRRSTAVRPYEDQKKSDVDVVVVTNIDRNKVSAQQALDLFKPFLEKYYKGKYKAQGRSWGIELSYVELDLVPTSAPGEVVKELIRSDSVQTDRVLEEAQDWRLSKFWQPGKGVGGIEIQGKKEDEQWRNEPLWIPDREAKIWDKTHPLAQIEATQTKNQNCNGHFINVVRCLKWWRTVQRPEPKYPKSYPLEHLCWMNCNNAIQSVAEGVVITLENIRDRYRLDALNRKAPMVPDHGVPEHNVLGRVSGDDFSAFHKHVTEAAGLARQAYDADDLRESVILWRKLFGERFPEPPAKKDDNEGEASDKQGGYTTRKGISIIGGGRFAI